MPSFNRIMMKFHAYKRVNKRRVHLGYYDKEEDAIEAERLGECTSKAHTKDKRAELKAATTVGKMVARLTQEGDR